MINIIDNLSQNLTHRVKLVSILFSPEVFVGKRDRLYEIANLSLVTFGQPCISSAGIICIKTVFIYLFIY